MEITETVTAKDREEWWAWLERHHQSEPEVWLIFYKKGSGIPSVTQAEAVEEALCFGWIDGLIKSLDEQRFAQRLTPRKNLNWSETNQKRALKMIQQGRMTPAGLAKINFPLQAAAQPKAPKAEPALPEELLDVIRANLSAWQNFEKLPPSHKRRYIGWILSARQADTRLRRTALAAEMLEYDLRLGMESPAVMLARAKANKDLSS
jgi:uncharacterized protein YdeI (YjbR/CyaY-like superfamily)